MIYEIKSTKISDFTLCDICYLVDFLYYQLLYSVFKPLTTFLIILLVVRFRNSNSYSKRILLGLIFCLFGDSFLLFENYFIFGLASFFNRAFVFSVSVYKGLRMEMANKNMGDPCHGCACNFSPELC